VDGGRLCRCGRGVFGCVGGAFPVAVQVGA
jgi:hypothetical protein